MTVWKLESGGTNEFAMLVSPALDDLDSDQLITNGKPKHWDIAPQVEPFFDKKKKKQKPVADLSHLAPGSIVLNAKAYAALSELMQQFGELLALDGKGVDFYFYNVTNLIDCIDVEKSEKRGSAIIKEAFLPESVPLSAQIFKDPRRARSDIYVNDAAKTLLEDIFTAASLTGARFSPAGASRY